MRYSALSLIDGAIRGNAALRPLWRRPEPQAAYDMIIIGGGGHGLSTAYYLAREHGATRVAVLEKGSLGLGNVGRNTTIVRANYQLPGNSEFYSHSLRLWEGLERELNFNVMHSQRGVIQLAHSDGQLHALARRGNMMTAQGDDAQLLTREQVPILLPYLDFRNTRFPVYGGLLHRRGGTARHDAVAWGYARAADRLGVDLIQNCEVTGIDVEGGRVRGVQTTRGAIRAGKVGIVVAGRSSQVAAMAGLRLPIESHVLQAFVTEGLKPVLDHVISYGMGHFYISQSDKGGLVFGGDLDFYPVLRRAREPAAGRAGHGGRDDADADDRSGQGVAQLGRDHGHDARWQSDHRPHADRGPLSRRGMVLWRVQGGSGLGLCVRASDGDGPPARDGCPLQARPVRARRAARRGRRGQPAQPSLTGREAHCISPSSPRSRSSSGASIRCWRR